MQIDEDVLDDWMSAFEALPEQSQDHLRRWFATQKLIIEASGLSPEAWFGYVEWAIERPMDYSFIEAFPAPEASVDEQDGSETDETRASRALVGAELERQALDQGEGVRTMVEGKSLEREVFKNFMQNHLGGRGR